MSRDWHEDMEYCNRLDDKGQSFISPEVLKYCSSKQQKRKNVQMNSVKQ